MLHGEDDPALARDTMFSVLMIILNGMVGLGLLLGGIRHREQDYNLQGAKSFLAVLIPLSVLTLILPNFTVSTQGPSFAPVQEGFFAVVTISLYAVFLGIQTTRHSNLFMQPAPGLNQEGEASVPLEAESKTQHHRYEIRSVSYHTVFLVLTMLPVVLLSKKFAIFVDYGTTTLNAPAAIGGLIIALLVLTPEGIGALEAAVHNQLQRAVNIMLGSALATIGLTIPAVLTISLIIEQPVELGLDDVEMLLLVLTLAVSALIFSCCAKLAC
ncbi:MAG: calcium:cation antiporter [Planctomycetota bacterium]|jgi:Ca2+:H+ antiporter